MNDETDRITQEAEQTALAYMDALDAGGISPSRLKGLKDDLDIKFKAWNAAGGVMELVGSIYNMALDEFLDQTARKHGRHRGPSR